jgi:hypothetical protein
MKPRRSSLALLLALAATAGAAQGAAPRAHDSQATPPAVARSVAQAHSIDAAVRQGRLTASQAEALQAARADQERRARDLARQPGSVDAALALSHEQDRLDWAIRSGNTTFVNTTLASLR